MFVEMCAPGPLHPDQLAVGTHHAMADLQVGAFRTKSGIGSLQVFPVVRVNLGPNLATTRDIRYRFSAKDFSAFARFNKYVGGGIPFVGEHLSGSRRQAKALFAFTQRLFGPLPCANVLEKGENQRRISLGA